MRTKLKKNYVARVLHALDHHGQPLKPIWDVLLAVMCSKGAKWESWKGGQQSNFFTLPDGRRVYAYGVLKPVPCIEIRNRPRDPNPIVRLETERDVWRYAATL
jgi:hypothetical protein